MTMTKPETVLDAFKEYEARMLKIGKPAEVKNMQTALLRFTVPGWGGYTPTNLKRSTKRDVEEGLNFLKLLPIKKLRDGIAAQERVFSQTDIAAKQRTNARYYLKKMSDLAEDEGWLREKESVEAPTPTPLRLVGGKKVPLVPRLTDRKQKPSYALGSQSDDFINPRLENEINQCRYWYITTKKLSEAVFIENFKRLRQFFGWLIRHEQASQWQTLEGEEKTAKFKEIMDGFCLENLIPFDPLPKRSQFTTRSEYLEAKEDAKDIRDEKADETIKFFKRFLDFYTENHATRGLLVKMAISFTEYLYRDEINATKPETIPPILLNLKSLVKTEKEEQQNSPRAVPIEKKFISYEEVLQVVVELKKRADQQKRVSKRKKTKNGSKSRAPRAIACDCSRFLIISFLSLLPPDRQQLVRELEIGTSFARGYFGPGNIFVPEDEMDEPSQAGWCFNLTKYKTRKTYGDCKITLPNYPFGDGTFLYDYVDLWLNQYRSLLNPKGNWLFVKHRKGDKWAGTDVYGTVVHAFHRYTGKVVNPHLLRHIFNY